MIVYFSGTGNSRCCARVLAEKLEDQLLDASGYIRNRIAADLVTGRPWVFVAPTYAWQLPRIFADFIRSGSFSGSTDAWFVMTCGGEIGNAAADIRTLCAEKGLTFRGVLEVVMPENYVAMFDVPEPEEARQIISAARPVLEAGAACILDNRSFPEKPVTVLDRVKSGVVNRVFYKRFVHARDFHTTDGCVGCGRCAAACVLGNITMENNRPVWGDSCTHCMACICGCPTASIEFGKKSQGKPRYWCLDDKD